MNDNYEVTLSLILNCTQTSEEIPSCVLDIETFSEF